jgi:hypothetical protein
MLSSWFIRLLPQCALPHPRLGINWRHNCRLTPDSIIVAQALGLPLQQVCSTLAVKPPEGRTLDDSCVPRPDWAERILHAHKADWGGK